MRANEKLEQRAALGVTRVAILVRALGVAVGAALTLWGAPVALNRVLFHGFAPACSDGDPLYDPRHCGITWQPGFLPLAVAVLGLLIVVVSVAKREFTGWLLVVVGGATMAMALFLLWIGSWDPATPQFPEPPGPQYVQFAVGAAATFIGWRVLRARPVQAASRL